MPVGKVAERSLAELGIDSLPSVRHPAQGGASLFRAQTRVALERLGLL